MSVRETKREIIDIMYICDICGYESVSMHTCNYCHRHVCGDHYQRIYNDFITNCDFGDYPNYICNDCYQKIHTGEIAKLITKYKHELRSLDELHDKIDDLITVTCRGEE